MSNLSILRQRVAQRANRRVDQLRLGALVASTFAANAMAQVGGGTGTGDAVNSRVTNTLSSAQTYLYGAGAVIMSAAVLYVAYGIAWDGKKWSDLAKVAGAMVAGGACVMISGWLFA